MDGVNPKRFTALLIESFGGRHRFMILLPVHRRVSPNRAAATDAGETLR